MPAPITFFNVNDQRLAPGRRQREVDAGTIDDFLRVLAICHTAVPEGEPTEEGISYQAESPDELAFITAVSLVAGGSAAARLNGTWRVMAAPGRIPAVVGRSRRMVARRGWSLGYIWTTLH